jgi:dihydroorotate dehydrogenase (fumarate)
MMNLKTTYLGLKLEHPFMCGASPLADDLEGVLRLEDAGSSAIVLRSLFEEQILAEQIAQEDVDSHDESFGEALSFLPNPSEFRLGADEYLEHIQKIRQRTSVPVIASLNGTSKGGWTRYARLMQDAGAHAIELNVYQVVTDPSQTGETVEKELLELVKSVKQAVKIPVAVKLTPFITSLPNLAEKLDKVPVDGLVLFNRFYQPDIDPENLKTVRTLELSDSSELLLRLHFLMILSGHVKASLAASGGIHSGLDSIKALMSGANAVQLVSALLRFGPERLKKIREEAVRWMEKFEYESVAQMIGSMNLLKCPDPKALERLNYLEILKSWRHVTPAV